MRKYIIAQKMDGTGSIHDLASDQYDRVIKFRAGCYYAVVLASYYGGRGYTTHKTLAAAMRASGKLKDYSRVIINDMGQTCAVGRCGYMHTLVAKTKLLAGRE